MGLIDGPEDLEVMAFSVPYYQGPLVMELVRDCTEVLVLSGTTLHTVEGDIFTGSLSGDIKSEKVGRLVGYLPGAYIQVFHPHLAQPALPHVSGGVSATGQSPPEAQAALWRVLDQPLQAINLPPEMVTTLHKASITYVGDLVQLREDELTSGFIATFGKINPKALQQALHTHGLRLQMPLLGWLEPDNSRRTGKPPER